MFCNKYTYPPPCFFIFFFFAPIFYYYLLCPLALIVPLIKNNSFILVQTVNSVAIPNNFIGGSIQDQINVMRFIYEGWFVKGFFEG
jgi:hypothetical protein